MMPADRVRRLLTNTAALVGAQLVVRALSLVAFPLLTNSVLPNTYGLYQYALQLAAAWAVVAGFQLGVPLIRGVARGDGEGPPAHELVGQTQALRLAFAAIVFAVAVAWAWPGLATGRERAIHGLLLGAALINALGATYDDTLKAREAFGYAGLVAVLQGVVVSGGIIIGVVVGRPIAWAVGSQVAGAALYLALSGWLASRVIGRSLLRLHWSPALVRDMLRLAFGVAVASQVGAWYGRADLLWVERLLDDTALGQYAVPYRALDVVMAGVMTLHAAVLPALVRAQARGAEALVPRMAAVLRLALLALLPFSALVAALAPTVMQVFRPDYAPGAGPLAILIAMAPLTFTNAVLTWVLYLEDRPWTVVGVMAAGLVLNAGLCPLLIPAWGIDGAAVARTLAEASITLAAAAAVGRRVTLPWAAILGKPLLMTAAMAAALVLWPSGPWWAGALAGVGAYVLTGALLRPLSERERAIVAEVLRRRRAGEGEA